MSYEMETEYRSMMVTLRYGALTYAVEALATLVASAVVNATLLVPVSSHLRRISKSEKASVKITKRFHLDEI